MHSAAGSWRLNGARKTPLPAAAIGCRPGFGPVSRRGGDRSRRIGFPVIVQKQILTSVTPLAANRNRAAGHMARAMGFPRTAQRRTWERFARRFCIRRQPARFFRKPCCFCVNAYGRKPAVSSDSAGKFPKIVNRAVFDWVRAALFLAVLMAPDHWAGQPT